MNLVKSILGDIRLTGEMGNWQFSASAEILEPGLELIYLRFNAPAADIPPHVMLEWSTPQIDVQCRWLPIMRFFRYPPPNWSSAVPSSLTSSIPLMQFLNSKGENRILVAVSDAMRKLNMKGGICEETNCIDFQIELFSTPEAPISSCELILRLDARKLFFADAIRSATDWYASFPEYAPTPVPDAAFEPIYSSWYSYHQNLFAATLEAECRRAAELGMKGIIVDDGWQTDDTNRKFAFCGDWCISKRRFPDMRSHVEKIHSLGMKYIVWYSVPFVGEKSENFSRFKSQFLYVNNRARAGVLDPRFPDVRDFLISTYENALKEWNIDGFKLDVIDSFDFKEEDPALQDDYAGRDIRSLPEAVDKLLSDVMARLKKIKPDILIEFRQSYIGPAIRKYGNMLRSADCPGDILSNRVNTIDLRLTSGKTAVHSDMLEWNYNDTPEIAALQFLNILFSVPQISIRIAELPEAHRKMLHFWLDFWIQHRELLLHGYLKPYHPELNYPIVSVENEKEKLIAVYQSGQYAEIDCEAGKICHVVNASASQSLVLELKHSPISCEYYDTMGNSVPGPAIQAGLARIPIPASGLLKITF